MLFYAAIAALIVSVVLNLQVRRVRAGKSTTEGTERQIRVMSMLGLVFAVAAAALVAASMML